MWFYIKNVNELKKTLKLSKEIVYNVKSIFILVIYITLKQIFCTKSSAFSYFEFLKEKKTALSYLVVSLVINSL